MPTGNMTFTNPYAARTRTYSSGSQVSSADLNAQQDGTIAVGAAVDTLVDDINDNLGYVRSGSGNAADSPAPDDGGARTVWVEMQTNGVSIVVLDGTFDWRDRYVIIRGAAGRAAADVAGGASDTALAVDLTPTGAGGVCHALFYTRDGQTGSASAEAYEHVVSGTQTVRFFARSSDGALCFRLVAAAGDTFFVGQISGSPKQNHY